MVVRDHGLPNSIIIDRDFLFTLKFWLSLCYFLGIKRRLSTVFHPKINKQTKRQNSTMEKYFWVSVSFEQNDWARLLPIAEFNYNNAKNTSTGHTLFKLNCEYYLWEFYEEDIDSRSKSKSADELLAELQKLMIVCHKNYYHAQGL